MSPCGLHRENTPVAAGIGASTSSRARIIEFNDQLRTTFRGGRVEMTAGVYNLDARLRGRALFVMSRDRTFADDSEHDWGRFIFAGYAFEWQIEYLARDATAISPDPADAHKTSRILTLYVTDDLLIPTRPRNSIRDVGRDNKSRPGEKNPCGCGNR